MLLPSELFLSGICHLKKVQTTHLLTLLEAQKTIRDLIFSDTKQVYNQPRYAAQTWPDSAATAAMGTTGGEVAVHSLFLPVRSCSIQNHRIACLLFYSH